MPHDHAAAVDETLGLGKIEAKRNRMVNLETIRTLSVGALQTDAIPGLNTETVFVEVEQFAQVKDDPRLRPVETHVHGSVELMSKAAPSISPGKRQRWTRQCGYAAIHLPNILPQRSKVWGRNWRDGLEIGSQGRSVALPGNQGRRHDEYAIERVCQRTGEFRRKEVDVQLKIAPFIGAINDQRAARLV